MKAGKIPETVLKRSVLRQLKTTRPEVLTGPRVGEDCGVLELGPDEVFVCTTDPVTASAVDCGKLGIHAAVNDLASAGAEPVAVMLSILLPVSCEEEELKEIMAQVEQTCAYLHIQVLGGHTESTTAVNMPVITVTGIGKAKKDGYLTSSGLKPGDDLVVTKWIGLEGTSIIVKEKWKELSERFPEAMLEEARDFDKYLSVVKEAGAASRFGADAMHDVTEGGIFGALWEMAECAGTGLEADLRKIPIRQETIEICEMYGLNPYGLISGGSLLIGTPDGYSLVRELEKLGIPSVVIGKAVPGNDRVVLNGGERRFLERPRADEIYALGQTDEEESKTPRQ